MTLLFKQKPKIISAIPWIGINADEIREFCILPDGESSLVGPNLLLVNDEYTISIVTENGNKTVPLGYWIIREPGGDFSICDPVLFEVMYEHEKE